MAKRSSLEFTPPITRVHNIFRIRTVVNAVSAENEKGKAPSDDEIGLVLAKSGLSKYRREKIKDRIMRRARDHLLTASYMGLLTRTGRPFGYRSTKAARFLKFYTAADECPKDVKEEAIFIDRILRLKLTNVYDLQLGEQYVKFRSRPCLYILHMLKTAGNWMHEHQIAVATGGKRCDPELPGKEALLVSSKLVSYDPLRAESLLQFYRDFRVKKIDQKNMTRNVRPLLDWCQSLGLVMSREVNGIRGRWYCITDRGTEMLHLYGSKKPVWYVDLGKVPSAKAALLIFYQYATQVGLDLKGILDEKLKTGLFTMRIYELVQDLKQKQGITLIQSSTSSQELDFSIEYDVPPDVREETVGFLKAICKISHMELDRVLQGVEMDPLTKLESMLEREQQNVRTAFTGTFAKGIAISDDPLLKQVPALVPSVGVLGQYRSDFEKEVVILLRLLGLNAMKYQGQLSDRSHKAHVITFFENNPDILIVNGVECLVECKSSGEWKPPLSGLKSVPKEMLIYQQYFPEVKPNSVVIVYEGALDINSKKTIESILKDSRDIVFATKNYLINCLHQPAFREHLMKTIISPERFGSFERILT